ncbi:MAG: 3-dehydroquinate synthase [Flavobacteriales bacterium]|jgi:3-dehydroquinate synthase|tara:strand:- start:1952 stop:3010 length:1059 start_codon:yes stop_codon:yes gene_type:complete
MKEIIAENYSIFFKNDGYSALLEHLKAHSYSKIFIHLDTNTKKDCLSILLDKIKINDFDIIVSNDGENHKNIETCMFLWKELSLQGADRKSLIINLGGGVVGDMGGFIASTFKRGIDYINIPTTLLSMVDASVGGKTGIDLGILKNQIGTFYDPKMVIIDSDYLKTLSKSEISSGYAEIFKHSLISDLELFNNLSSELNSNIIYNDQVIQQSIEIKNKIVLIDKKENKERKALNFGHTLGHAIESFFLNSDKRLLHGEAIGIGIVLASYISYKYFNFPLTNLDRIKNHILSVYKKSPFNSSEITKIIELLKHDKKNSHGKINFVLLKEIGVPVYDIQVENKLIIDSFEYYNK